MAEEMEQELEQPTAEALKQRRKREKSALKDAALGIGKFQIEVAGAFKPDLQKVMKAHGINNQQDIHQRLLINLIAADFEVQAWMLRCVVTPFVVSEKVSQLLMEAGLKWLATDPPESDDEVVTPLDHSA